MGAVYTVSQRRHGSIIGFLVLVGGFLTGFLWCVWVFNRAVNAAPPREVMPPGNRLRRLRVAHFRMLRGAGIRCNLPPVALRALADTGLAPWPGCPRVFCPFDSWRYLARSRGRSVTSLTRSRSVRTDEMNIWGILRDGWVTMLSRDDELPPLHRATRQGDLEQVSQCLEAPPPPTPWRLLLMSTAKAQL